MIVSCSQSRISGFACIQLYCLYDSDIMIEVFFVDYCLLFAVLEKMDAVLLRSDGIGRMLDFHEDWMESSMNHFSNCL